MFNMSLASFHAYMQTKGKTFHKHVGTTAGYFTSDHISRRAKRPLYWPMGPAKHMEIKSTNINQQIRDISLSILVVAQATQNSMDIANTDQMMFLKKTLFTLVTLKEEEEKTHTAFHCYFSGGTESDHMPLLNK